MKIKLPFFKSHLVFVLIFSFFITEAQVPCFSTAVNYASGGNATNRMLRGNFNADGHNDLVIANFGSNNVSILLGSASGTFGAATNFNTASGPIDVVAGDFNSDGNLDIATANFGASNVSVLFGNGSGAFAAPVNYAAGSFPQGINITDVNGDGNTDLIVANNSGLNISVLVGSASGTFAAAVNYPISTNAQAIISDDFNNDGNPDIAVTNNGVSVLFGSASGTFAAAVNYFVGSSPRDLATDDLNGDGNLDIVTVNLGSGNMSVLFGSASGTFAAAVNYFIGAGTQPFDIVLSDLNGDGYLDAACALSTSNQVAVLAGSPSGTFAPAVTFAVGALPRGICSGDFNGDGALDIATANNTGNNTSVLLACTPSGAALNFDGANDNVLRSIFNTQTTNVTLQAKVKSNGPTGANQSIIYNGNTSFNGYGIFVGSGVNTVFAIFGGISFYSVNYTLTPGKWTSLALVIESNKISFYADGVLTTTLTTANPNAILSGSFCIGSNNGGVETFNGSIDEVQFWNVARTQCQIVDNLYSEIPTTAPNLLANYHFNQGVSNGVNSGVTTLIDATGSFNCTLSNFALTGASSNWVAPGGVVSGYSLVPSPAADIALTGNGNSIVLGSTTPTLSNHTDFAANSTRTFVIQNTGSGILNIGLPISISGANAADFNLTTAPSQTIGPFASSNFVITFNPAAVGTRSATIKISSSDCDEPTYSFVVQGNKTGSALNFDGVNDRVIVSTGISLNNQSFSIEFWAKRTGTASAYVVGQGNSIGTNQSLHIGFRPGPGNEFTFAFYSNDLNIAVPATTDGNYHHWACVFNHTVTGTNRFVYCDGVLIASDRSTSNFLGSGPFVIGDAGYYPSFPNPFNGSVDEVRIWSVPRTQCEIQTFMNCEIPTSAPGLQANYHFNQGFASLMNFSETTLNDASTNGRHGTLNNFNLGLGSISNWVSPGGIVNDFTTSATPQAEINIAGNGITIVDGDVTPSVADFTDFNGVSTRTFVIDNAGGLSTLNVNNILITGTNASEFSVTALSSSTLAAVTGTSALVVAFTPTSVGLKTATININNNDCSEPVYNFAIQATPPNAEALDFDGASDYVNTNLDVDVDVMPNTTWEAWVYPTSTIGADKFILSIGDGGLDRGISAFGGQFYVSIGTGYNVVAPFTINTWYHLAVSFNTSTNRVLVYINGVLEYEGFSNWTLGVGTTANNLKIGAAQTVPNFFWDGKMDEVRIWNTIRSQCEIQTFMNAEITSTASGLVANYHFNQGLASLSNITTTTLIDAAGANTGTLNTFALTGAGSNWVAPSIIASGFTTSSAPTATMNIQGNGNNILNNSIATSTTNYTDFGSVSTRTYVIQNAAGASVLNIGTPYLTGGNAVNFSVTVLPATTLAAAGSTSFVVTFTAGVAGTKTAVVNIPNNDCAKPNYNFVISATPPAGEALSFDGVNDRVNTIDIDPGVLPVMTFEAWVYRTGGSGNQTIIGNDDGGWDRCLIIQSNSVTIWAGRNIITPFTSSLNTWEHYAVTWSASEVTCVKNGTLVFKTSGETIGSSVTNAGIGAVMSAWLFPFQGKIDEVRIWNTARTQCEIQTYMNAEITSTASGLIVNHHFNQGLSGLSNLTTTTAIDASGSSNTGTLSGFALTGATSNWVVPGGVVSGFTTTSAPTVTLAVSGNGNNVPQSVVTTTLNNTNFGTNSSRTFSITNTSGTLNINPIFFTGPNAAQFSITTAPASSLAVGGTSFVITLTPTNTGISTATVNIPSNDCTNPTFTFVITASTTPASALNFDGTSDYVNCGNILPGSYTKEAWINLTTGSAHNNIMSGGAGASGHAFYVPSSTGFKLSGGHNGSYTTVMDPTPLVFGTWYHVAITYNVSTGAMKLYKDGVLVSSANSVAAPTSSAVTIGWFDSVSFFKGTMDEVRLWNTERNQCEIQTYMNCEIPASALGLVANYHFNQGIPLGANPTQTLLTDATGANTGTLNTFALTGTVSNWVSPGGVASGFTTTSAPTVTLAVSGNGNNVPQSAVTTTANNTDFGTNTSGTFSITNTSGTLNINPIFFTGPNAAQFSVTTVPASTIAAGGTSFVITLTPTNVGVSSATVNIPSNDCTNPTYSFVITASTTPASALNFDGTSDYVNCGNILPGSYTKEAWINLTSGSANNNIMSGGAGASGHAFFVPASSGFRLSGGHNGSWTTVLDPTPLVFGNWYHVAITYNASTGTMKLYKNGVLVSNAFSVPAPTSSVVTIGWFELTSFFKGTLDEVRLWNTERTQCEIQTFMNCEIPSNAGGLIANYHFNQGIPSGSNSGVNTLTDATGTTTGTLMTFALTGTTSNWVSPGGVTNGFTTAVAPTASLVVSGNGNNVPQGVVTNTNNNTDFGTNSSRTFSISNASGTLNINPIFFTGPNAAQFSVTTVPAATIAAGGTSFVITLTPTNTGISTATVNIPSNDCTNPTYSFVITASTTPASALSFDGTNDYVQANHTASIMPTNSISVEAWVNLNNTSGIQYVVSKGTNDGVNGHYGLYFNAGLAGFHLYQGSHVSAQASVAVPTGTWLHLAGTWDGTNIRIYVNGVLSGTQSINGPLSINTGSLQIGRLGAPGFLYQTNGKIDEVRIWNTTRTQCEIQTYMNAEITSTASGLVANYHFNQGIPSGANATQTLLTEAAGANTGTLTSFALTSGTLSNWVSPGGVVNGFTTTSAPSVTLAVSGNGNNVPQSVVTTTANNTDFGTNSSRTFSITNTSGTLNINPIFFTGPNAAQFSVTTAPANSLTAGGTSFVITLTPTNTGISTATVNIPSNDCANPTYSFVITASTSAASALSFDGANDHVLLANNLSSWNIGNNFTIETWLKPNSVASTQLLLYTGYGCIDCPAWALSIGPESTCGLSGGSSGRIVFMASDKTSTNAIVQSLANPTIGVWTHVAVTGNGSTLKMYVNGVLQSTAALTFTIPSSTYRNIGADPSVTGGCNIRYVYNGTMDELRFWNVARTQCEIQQFMSAEITSTASGLTANYHFNQGIPSGANPTQTLLTDAAAANNGTVTNFALTSAISNWVSPGGVANGFTTVASQPATFSLTGNGNNVPQGVVTNTNNNTDFGTNPSRTFSITNGSGSGTLHIQPIYFTGPNAAQFSVTTAPASTIAAGGTSFVITLTPTNTGISSATVNIPSNDCTNPTYSFVITASTTPASALNFDGVNDYVNLGSSGAIKPTNALSVETWANLNNWGAVQSLVSNTQSNGYAISVGGGNLYGNVRRNGAYAVVSTPTTGISPGWHHVAMTFDGRYTKLYLDGILKSTDDAGGTYTITYAANSTFVGAEGFTGSIPEAGYYSNGSYDEVRIWNLARTQCQIQTFMNAEITSTASGLVANYHFNQGIPSGANATQTLLTDAAGANTGTLNTFALSGAASNWVSPGGVVNGFTTVASQPATFSLTGNGNNVPQGVVTNTNNNTDFGTNPSRTFSITNGSGSGTLHIQPIYFTGPNAAQFSVTTAPASTIAAGGTSFVITLTPTNTGISSATVNIPSNDCTNPTYSFVITASTTPASALDFDGLNDFVVRPEFNFGTGDFAVEAWVKPTNFSNYRFIISNRTTENTSIGNFWELVTQPGGQLVGYFGTAGTSTDQTVVSTNSLTLNTWQHVALVRTGLQTSIYVNGLLEGTETATLSHNLTSGNNTVAIGTWYTNPALFRFGGSIDEVRVWNTSRSQCQLQQFMNCEITSTASGLVANYHFNEGIPSGSNSTYSILTDATGANSGTLTNFALTTGSTSNWVTPGGVVSGFTTALAPTASINVTGNGNPISNNAVATSTTNFTDFGSASTRTYVIQNTAVAGVLNVATPYFSGANASEFSVTVLPAATVAASGTTSFVVAFTPTAGGTRTCVVNITSNDCGKPNYNYVIQGAAPTAEALSFDGSNDAATRAVLSNTQTNITLQAKVYWAGNNGLNQMVMYNGNSGSSGYGIYTHIAGNISVLFGGINYFPANYTLTPNVWTSLTAVIKNGTTEFYVNGILTNNLITPLPAVPSGSFNIGNNGLGFENFNGKIDEVLFWGKALSQCEIQTFQNCEIPTSAINLLANYHFNQGGAGVSNSTVTTLTDDSGNSNNMTLTGFALTGTVSNWVSPGAVVSGFTTTSAPSVTLAVSGNGNNVPQSVVTTTANNTDFGTNSSKTFSITNTTGTLSINPIFFTGPNAAQFSVTTAPANSLTAGGTSFVITLTPTNTGISTATVNIPSNDCTNPTYSFVITASTSAASALSFDGMLDFVDIPTSTVIPVGNSPYTIESWIKPNTFGTYGIVGWGNYGNSNETTALRLGAGGFIIHYWWANDLTVAAPTLTNGNWHHVAATFDGTTRAVYVDGIMAGSDTPTGHAVPNNANMRIGSTCPSPCNGEFFDGSIDEVRIWNVARTQCELQTYMGAEITTTASGLVANYHFNQGIPSGANATQTLLTDAANANTGTLTGFALTSGSVSNWISPGGVINGFTTTNAPTASIVVSGNGNNIPQGVATNTNNNTDFGTNSSRTFSITNTSGTLNINPIFFTGPNAAQFSVTTAPASSLTAGGTSFVITLTPTNTGISTATVNIPSNDCTNPTYSFVITASTTPASALSFDGVNDFVTSTQTVNATSGTFEAWINKSNWGDAHDDGLFSNTIHFSNANSFYMSLHPVVGLHFRYGGNLQGGNFYASSIATTTLSANSWHHVAGTWNTAAGLTTLQLYLDGVLVASNQGSISFAVNTGTLNMGLNVNNVSLLGKMDEVRIWNTVRSQCEIQTFMNAEITTTASGLVSNYHFNQGIPAGANATQSVLTDATGVNNGTLTNFALTTGTLSNWVSPGGVANGFTTTSAPTVTLVVSGNGNNVPQSAVTTTLNNTDFGTNASRTFSITNTTGTLNINPIFFTGPNAAQFSVTTAPASTIAAGGTSFVITLTPTNTGISTATVNIPSNDCTNPTFTFVITASTTPASALNFDGVNDVVNCGTDPSLDITLGTWEAWVNLSTLGTNSRIFFKENFDGGGTGTYESYYLAASGKFQGDIKIGGTPYNVIGSTSPVINTWYHVALTYDGTFLKLYVNGVLDGVTNISGGAMNPGTGRLSLGASINNPLSSGLSGKLDEARLWNFARTQCEIQTFMNAEITSTASGLVANYHFNQGIPSGANATQTLLTDVAGANTGTLTNFALTTGSVSNWVTPGGVANGFTTTSAPSVTLVVSGNGNNVPQSAVTTTLNNTDFGTNLSKTFSVTNTSGTLNINPIFFTGPNAAQFFVTTAPANTLASGSTSFVITLTPTNVGVSTATVNIPSNDCTNPTYSFVITASVSAASALSFDGNNDVVRGSVFNTNISNVSLEAFVNWNGTNGVAQVMVHNGNTGGDGIGIFLPANSSQVNLLLGGIFVGGLNYTLVPGVWTKLSLVINNGVQSFYANGVLVSTYSIPGIAVPTTSFCIGANHSGVQTFNGKIDEVRYWNKALTQCEIQTNLNNEIPTSAVNLSANYHFNQGIPSGTNAGLTTVLDDSGNSNNLILGNFALTGTVSNWVSPGAVANGFTTTTAQPATFSITGNGNNVPQSVITNTNNNTDFSTNSSRTFSITNGSGSGTLHIQPIYFTGPNAAQFSVTTTPAATLASGGTSFVITLTPTNTGISTATVNIPSNDCTNPTYSFVITASTTPAAALDFDNNNDYVNLGNGLSTLFDPLNNITLEAWVKPTSNIGLGSIVGNWQSPVSNMQFLLQRAGNQFALHIDGGPGYLSLLSAPNTVTLNTWQHVAGVWDGAQMRLYINGVLHGIMTNTGSSFPSLGNNVLIGGNNVNEQLTGSIDEVRIWTLPRTQCQIQTFMNAEITTTASGLVANYHFNQGIPSGPNLAVTTLTDATGAYNGTLTNMALASGSISNWVSPGGVVNGFTTTLAPTASINVTGNGVTIANNAVTTNTNDFTNFNGVSTRTFVIQNNAASGVLNVATPNLTGVNASEFSITVSPASTVAASGGTTFFVVAFTPTAGGLRSATVNINSNDCSKPIYNFRIDATPPPASALSFDGNNDYLVGPLLSTANNSVTLEAKVFYKGSNGFHQTIIQNGPSGYGLVIQASSGILGMYIGGAPMFVTTYTVPLLQWVSISAVILNNVASVYANGVLVASIPYVTAPSFAGGCVLGGGPGDHLNGNLDEVRLWDKALTQCEIQTYLNCEIPGSFPNLKASYHFNQGSAILANPTTTIVLDASGNNFSLTANNFAMTGTVSNWVNPGGVTSGFTTTSAPNVTVNLSSNGNPIVAGSIVTSTLNNTSFGNLCVGSPTVNRTYSVVNSGTVTLYLNNINVSGSPNFTVSTYPSSVAASGSATFPVTFSVGAVGVSNATINITSNDCNNPLFTFAVTASVVALPTVSIGNYTICSGSTLALVPSGANTYTVTGNNFTVTPLVNTSYSVTGTSSLGCVSGNTAVSNVLVNSSPTITVNSGSICLGNTFVIVPSGANTYTFSGLTASVSPVTTTAYSVTGTSTSGCISSSAAISNVTVIALPTIAVNSGTICEGQSFTINPSGALSYTITGGNFVVTPTLTGSYSVTGTSSVGCISASAAVSDITVHVNPTITVSSGTICEGQSFTIVPNGANTYSYTGGSVVVSPTITSSYSVTGTSTAGCVSASAAVSSVTVFTNPTITVTSGTICPGETFTIVANGASTYSYEGGSSNVSPSVTTSYSVTGTSTAGCVSTIASSTVNVNAQPTISIIASNTAVCVGFTANLTATGAATYTWSSGLSNNTIFTPTSTGIYTVTGTGTNSCTSTSTIELIVNPIPSITVLSSTNTSCEANTVTLTVNGASTYSWTTLETGSVIVISPSVTTTYTISATDVNSCTNTATYVQSVTICDKASKSNPLVSDVSCKGKNDGVIILKYNIPYQNKKVNFLWDQGLCPGNNCDTLKGLKKGTYNVSIIVNYTVGTNLVRTDTLVVKDITVNDDHDPCDVKAFTGITLNGDGSNDTWRIENIDLYPKNQVTLYSRWGTEVANIKGYDNDKKVWPTSDEAKKLLSGTYFYVVDLGDGSPLMKGWIEIFKN